MITPAEFEDRMRQIVSETNISYALAQVYLLMSETLDDLGYTAGVRLFHEMVSRRRTFDDKD